MIFLKARGENEDDQKRRWIDEVRKALEEFTLDEFELLELKQFPISCCRSYCTPKGRCYSCPEELDTELEEPREEND